jgi:TolB-like protein/Tfp pilus assembly protein PilF
MFQELRRRNMFRVAGMYFVVSWLLLQLAVVLEGSLNLPSWFDTFVTVIVMLGFPVAMVLAWAFEMTPEGIKPTESVDREISIRQETGQRLDLLLASLLVLVGAIVLSDRFIPNKMQDASAQLAEPASRPSAPGITADIEQRGTHKDGASKDNLFGNSIAVLPFADLSEKGDQAYFSDGIAEELMNVLAQIPALEVAGRTSSFAFKGKSTSLDEIGDILRVTNILEGSIRKSGDKIRVAIKLINVSTGYQRWSSIYNRDLTDIFAVQDEISQAILTELTPHLIGSPQGTARKSPPIDLQVYDFYLLSKQYAREGTFEAYKRAIEVLDQALVLDPEYVPALVWRAYYEIVVSDAPGFQGVPGVAGVIPIAEASEFALDKINRALELEPSSADALFARATVYSTRAEDTDKAERDYREAIRLKPNFSLAKNDLAVLLESKLNFTEAFQLLEEALSHDPGLVDANFNLFQGYYWRSKFADAQRVLDSWARISPDDKTRQRLQAEFAFDTGDMAKGMKAGMELLEVTPDTPQMVRFLATGWLSLGAYSKVLLSAYDQHHPFALSGELAAGRALAEKNLAARPDDVDHQQVYMDYLFFYGDWQDLTDFYDATYGSVKAVRSSAAYPPFEKLSAALQATGHKHAKAMQEQTRRHIDAQRQQSISLSVLDQEEAVLLIVEGKPDRAMARLNAAFDQGGYDINIKQNPAYRSLAAREDYQDLCKRTLAVINAERAKLGLEPTSLAGDQ